MQQIRVKIGVFRGDKYKQTHYLYVVIWSTLMSIVGNLLKTAIGNLQGQIDQTQTQASVQDKENANASVDWRVRLSLAPGANYLYKDETNELLYPLAVTDGVIFPYTPNISITYGASYNSVVPVHSNYKIFQYESSYVDNINITCDFTAQDVYEANYLLATIIFFRSVTKMFYGQDEDPKPGTPPPLCFLSGLGQFQFNRSPLAITNFTYNLPPDVDYIRAGVPNQSLAVSGGSDQPTKNNGSGGLKGLFSSAVNRLAQGAIKGLGSTASGLLGSLVPGGLPAAPAGSLGLNKGFNSLQLPGTAEPTYVPTKINISISAVPIVSRYDVSNVFSLKDYSNGKLIKRGAHW